jgi:ADP-heptose:LPS heptosyltransferase
MEMNDIRFDCRYFRGEIPCIPNKLRDKVCTCDEYTPVSKKILIIKLGALGDVIRSTPLAVKYRKLFPGCHITWITHSPEILPKDSIDRILKFDFNAVFAVTHQKFDIAINLDKEIEACSLLKDVEADEKYGFIWNNSHIDIANPEARHKLITGLFDNISKLNTKSYVEEIFEICRLKFEYEPYLLNFNSELSDKWKATLRQQAGSRIIVGLNTGCGKRWSTRLWPVPYWKELIMKLQDAGYYPVLLGGQDEDAQNKIYAASTGAYYPGTFSLEEFISLTNNCDIILTAVSMMMHIAVGLKKPLILFNNIFNRHEFEMYGRGQIIEPETGCDCYYGNICIRERHCMNDISVERIFNAIKETATSIHPVDKVL